MPPGRSTGGSGSSGGRGRGGRGRGGRGGRRGRGGRSSGRGTALPSSFTGRGVGGAQGDDRRRRGGRDRGSAGYEFDDGEGGVSDRHKFDDEAGDSDDGPGPEDSDFEDEEVDEDAAFDSADEARFGEIMDTILGRRRGAQGGGSDEEGDPGDESDDDDDDDDDAEGGMSVMDMLAANEAAEAATVHSNFAAGKEEGKGRAAGAGAGIEESGSGTAPASDAGSTDDASGDEAGVRGDDAMDEDDSDEDDEEGDEEERHARLMGFVGTLGEQAAAAQRAAEDRRSSQLLREGEFNASAVAASGGAKRGAVTMETLMGSLQNSKGFAAVKKQVAAFSGKSGAPSAPVSKTAELRAERETAYDSRKSDMGKWVAPVQANRKAETLDFTPAVKTNLSNAALASKMEPTTDMEREVEMLLTAGGATEEGLAEKEMEELKAKAYTVEEVKERQAELSKMRALMFYQERKQHHMNKIKSKVYRKIKKRQRERAGDGQKEDDGDQGEAAAKKRAEERMSLRHKNTTKWVKNALRAKGGAGKDDRRAISEQLKLGQELRAKMDGVDSNSSADDSSSSEEEDEGEEAGKRNKKGSTKRKAALRDADRKELEGIGGEGEGEGEDGIAAGGKGAALFKMAFMQKAMNKQRERAREEAAVVLRELEEASATAAAAEGDNSEDETRTTAGKDEGEGAGSSWGQGNTGVYNGGGGVSTRSSAETRAKAAADVAKALPSGALQSSAVSMDARVRSSVASPITIDLGGGAGGGGGTGGSGSSSSMLSAGIKMGAGEDDQARSLNRSGGGGAEAEAAATASRAPSRRQHQAGEGRDAMSDGEEEEDRSNPWLAPTPRRSKERRRESNGEVLLDVRKAAATALSAFGGVPNGGEGSSVNGGAGARPKGAGSAKPGGAGKDEKSLQEKPTGQGQGQGQGQGRKKKRRRSGGDGGDGDSGGADGASDGMSKNATKSTSSTKSAAGDGKAARAGGTAAVAGGGKQGAGDSAPAAKKRRKKRQKKTDGRQGSGDNVSGKSAETTGVKKADGGKKAGQAGAGAADSKLVGLSNDELVRRAFAAPDFEAEFKDSKDDEIEAVLSKGREKLPGTLEGWGSWAGDGAPVPRGPTKRQAVAKEAQTKKEEVIKRARKDDRLPKVMLNEKRQKRSAKYMVSEVPYPFTSREQYERSLRQPIGGEWNTSQSVRAMTRPAVVVRAGVAVAPMKLGKLHRDNAKEKSAEAAADGAKAKAKGGERRKARGGAGRRRGSKGGPV